MTALRFYFEGDRLGQLFTRSVFRKGDAVRAAARATAHDVADQIVRLGQADISAAGKFGTRWTSSLYANVSEGGGNIKIDVGSTEPLFPVFEEGRVIQGKPMLWIPLSFAGVPKGTWASAYAGRLVRVPKDRNLNFRKDGGAALLVSTDDGQPKYFGKESVTIPKKFHIDQIIRTAAQNMRALYLNYYDTFSG